MFDVLYENYTKSEAVVFLGTITLLIPFLIRKLVNKKKDIRKPINNESYCIISIYICNMIIASLSFQLISNILQIMLSLLMHQPSQDMVKKLTWFCCYWPLLISYQLAQCVVTLQTWELVSMLNIIHFQKNKTMEDIYFIIQNDPSFHGFKKREMMLRGFFCLFVVMQELYSIYVFSTY